MRIADSYIPVDIDMLHMATHSVVTSAGVHEGDTSRREQALRVREIER
jgi:hypothetical protein